MKRKRFVGIFHAVLCIYLHAWESVPAGNLMVVVLGLKNYRGDVQIGLFNSVASYQGKNRTPSGFQPSNREPAGNLDGRTTPVRRIYDQAVSR
ncbi:MAG TPA: hypothetical protein VGD14_08180 [bacterium]